MSLFKHNFVLWYVWESIVLFDIIKLINQQVEKFLAVKRFHRT